MVMKEEEIRVNFSKNLVLLRKANNLSQSDLATALSYSDKAISKWENQDTIPDIVTISNIANYFHITVDELISNGDVVKASKTKRRRLLVIMSSTSFCVFVVLIAYLVLELCDVSHAYLVLPTALVSAGIVATVLSALWYKRLHLLLSISLIIWGVGLQIILFMNFNRLWIILVISAVLNITFIPFLRIFKK